MGSDVLLQPSTLQADNHKKRTGFGPQQASFGVYVSNAFGGMSGALNLGAAELELAAEEVTELDQATAPTPLYPHWFHERTADATVRDALKQGLPARTSEVKA